MAAPPNSPQPRLHVAKADTSETTRNSNYLRASVLDAALQLGFGSSRTVEDWMFNSVLEGQDESENVASPGLTSASTATSDESFLSPGQNSPATPYSPIGKSVHIVTGRPDPEYAAEWREHVGALPMPSAISSPSASPVKVPAKPNKLKKQRKADGSESDAGYISEGAGKKGKEREKDEEKARKKEQKEREKKEKKEKKKSKKGKDGTATETEHEHESDGGYLSDMHKKKPKKKVKGDNDSRKAKEDTYGGDTSDGGYLSEASTKRKRSFFRLGTRSRKASTGPADAPTQPLFIPPVPAMPDFTLPIAERFTRSPAPSSLDIDDYSRSVTPVLSTTRTSYTTEGRLSLASSSNFTPTTSIRHAPSIASLDTSSSSVQSPPSPVSAPTQTIPRVRFTPSTVFDAPPTPTTPTPVSPISPRAPSPAPTRAVSPAPPATSAEPPRRPPISLPLTSPAASPSPLSIPNSHSPSSRSPSPQPFLCRIMRPSPLSLAPSPSPAPSSAVSETFTIISSSDFVVPSPSFPRRSALLNPPRGHLGQYDLPPPSPPPRGPLPSVPGGGSNELSFPLPPPRATPSPSGLFSQPIPPIQRGREIPFPARPVLPAAESSDLVRRTNTLWRQRVPNITIDEPDARSSAESGDADGSSEAEMRPDIARFYFNNSNSAPGTPTTASGTYPPETEAADDDDDRSMYPPTLATRRTGSYVDSYYFDSEDGQRRMSLWSRRASFLDNERSDEVRRQFVARVGALYDGGEEEIPPVPKLLQKF